MNLLKRIFKSRKPALQQGDVSGSLADAKIFDRYDMQDFLRDTLNKHISEEARQLIMEDFQTWVTKSVNDAEDNNR